MSCFRIKLLAVCFTLLLTGWGQIGVSQERVLPSEQELIAVLQSDADGAKKAMACKHLAIQGTSASVPALVPLLKDEKLASWARIALEAIPGTIVDEAMRKSTEDLRGLLLVGALNTIGVRRDSSAVNVLKGHLENKDAEVASAAAVALGRIGNAAATQVLRESMANSPMAVRTAIAEGLIYCAERFHSEGNSVEAAEIYDAVRNAVVPKQRIVEATRGAILARKQDGIALLVEQLRSTDKALFHVALGTAREFPGSEVDPSLAAEIERTTPERGALIIAAMADRKESLSNLAAIQKAVGSSAKSVKLAAIEALGRVGNSSSVSTLLDAANGGDTQLAEASKLALSQLPDERVDQEIVARLAKSQSKELAVLIDVVGQRRIPASSELIKALDSSDKTVRASALTSLGAIVPPEKMSVLIAQVVSPKSDTDLELARSALKTAAIRMPDREACASELASASERSPVATKVVLLEILGAVGGTKALQAVGTAAKSNDEQLKDVGSRLLGEWQTIDGAPVLLELAKTGPLSKYQARALKGYIRMARQFTMQEAERISMCKNAYDACRQTEERRLLLEVLKRNPNVETLKLAVKLSDDPKLKAEALSVTKEIAKKLPGNSEAQQILSKAEKGT